MPVRPVLVALLALLGPGLACQPAPPKVIWPQGHWIVGDARAWAPLVRGLASLDGTPVGSQARAWLDRLAACEEFALHANVDAPPASWLEGARCAQAVEVPAVLQAQREGAAAVFSFPMPAGRHLHGRLVVGSQGHHRLQAVLERTDEGLGELVSAAVSLLVQGDAPAGTPRFSAADALIHARIRPADGLDLAPLVRQGSQADQMFHLRSELFVGALLDGSFELAVYLPRADQVTPPMALALDHTLRAGAERAMQTFVSELESTWPIHHANREIAGHPGACFHDLKLLPDLVPCYVVSDRSIVVGWNPASIELALGQSGDAPAFVSGPTLGERGGWLVHLDRFAEADARLQRQLAGGAPHNPLAGLFDSLRVDARRAGQGVVFEAEFVRELRMGAMP